MKKFPKIFKYTNKGQVQEWQIIAEGDKFWTIEGIKDGKLTTSLPTICIPKNIGKKNETTGVEQALLEAQAKWQKKVDSGYNEILSAEKKFVEPMLAEKLEDRKNLLFTVRTFISRKLDGLRAINKKNTIISRNGKMYISVPHLYQDKLVLDGELFNPDFNDDFNTIVSLCKKTKPTQEDLDISKRDIQYHIYDLPSQKGVFSERYKALQEFFKTNKNPAFKMVESYEVFSMDDIQKYHEQFIEEGYEGSIVRLDLGDYEFKRSKQLLKYKDWMDSEFELVGYEEGEGGRVGTIGKFYVRLDKNLPYNIEKKENVCKSNVKGNFDFLRQVWIDRDSYIGTDSTIKFFGYTPDGALRFPYIIKLNRKEYE